MSKVKITLKVLLVAAASGAIASALDALPIVLPPELAVTIAAIVGYLLPSPLKPKKTK